MRSVSESLLTGTSQSAMAYMPSLSRLSAPELEWSQSMFPEEGDITGWGQSGLSTPFIPSATFGHPNISKQTDPNYPETDYIKEEAPATRFFGTPSQVMDQRGTPLLLPPAHPLTPAPPVLPPAHPLTPAPPVLPPALPTPGHLFEQTPVVKKRRRRKASALTTLPTRATGGKKKRPRKNTKSSKRGKPGKGCEDPFVRMWAARREDEATNDQLRIFVQENGDPNGPGLEVDYLNRPKLLEMAKKKASQLIQDRKLANPGTQYWQGAQREILAAFRSCPKLGATCKTIAILCNRPYEKTRANVRWLKDFGALRLHPKKVVAKKPQKRAVYLHYFELVPERSKAFDNIQSDAEMTEQAGVT